MTLFTPRETSIFTSQLFQGTCNEGIVVYEPSKVLVKPRNCLTSVTDVGVFQFWTTVSFSGSGFKLVPLTMCSINLILERANSHLTKLQKRLLPQGSQDSIQVAQMFSPRPAENQGIIKKDHYELS